MQYVFIADFFKTDVCGGGEIVNDVLITALRSRGHTVLPVHSHQVTLFTLEEHSGSNFIIGNFLNLAESCKRKLAKEKYVIYEHDHKYLKTRDPSVFENFKAPPDQVINRDFYRNAAAVVCQTKVHAMVLRENLGLQNVINATTNPWTDEELNHIEHLRSSPNARAHTGVMNSTNVIKNTSGAIEYCASNKMSYQLLGPCAPSEFLKQLSECEGFAFFPTVLETYSRVVVEARMLECKIYVNHLIGATSEDWFKLRGKDLIEHLRNQREKVIDIFVNTFKTPSRYEDITVILNAYRRPYNLQKQIDSIKNQTRPPKQIWVWVNDHEDLAGFDFESLDVDRIVRNDYNWKFYGRFAGALLADTEYVAIFDDDTIPGTEWFANCLECMDLKEGIMGSAGYIQTGPQASQYIREGWPSNNQSLERVDYVGHAWFFRRSWLSHLWREKPPCWDNSEDIHFSYTAQKYGGIQTYCPPHPPQDQKLHGSLFGNELGVDSKATSNNQAVSHQTFFSERDYCIGFSLKGGWKTVNMIKKGK